MTKEELRKQTEEAKLEAFSLVCKKVAELEKENAELKEKVNILDNCDRLGDMITEAYKDQLTKAKEIIKKIEKIFYSGENAIKRLSEISDILAEAEQFLKGVEK